MTIPPFINTFLKKYEKKELRVMKTSSEHFYFLRICCLLKKFVLKINLFQQHVMKKKWS